MKTNRLNAIVDGVFAIAMTLLVLDLPRPNSFRTVTHDLEVHWDAYIAYLVSFATLGVVWLEHHGMMLAVRRTSRTFIEITFAFLLFVALLPWPTALTAEFADEASTSGLVTFLYSATMLLIAASLVTAWSYLGRHPNLLAKNLAPGLRHSFRRTCLICIPYVVAMPIALVSPLASLLIDASVVVYLATSLSPLERAEAERAAIESTD
jgi:TMEM175 potassium channel family protein